MIIILNCHDYWQLEEARFWLESGIGISKRMFPELPATQSLEVVSYSRNIRMKHTKSSNSVKAKPYFSPSAPFPDPSISSTDTEPCSRGKTNKRFQNIPCPRVP